MTGIYLKNEELIHRARAVIRPREIRHGFMVGEVGCALLTDKGNVYLGISIDVVCGIGFCAEHGAVAAMLTYGEHRIRKIVAVVASGKAIAPCGRCRELIRQVHDENLETDVVLGVNNVVKLRSLLPVLWDG